ncbi:hypothetical protein HYALB_00001117 [Hymenoscyphus albidus]|uniref:Uncharacterized protein n=1 Tax=Hymenoscyphus albidus TaxID=595503 RepID=A0A9N9LE48_9HELO|nr:hypothetical protein HYALB_00001117 [Hymenoscyphus albidus]
MGGSCLGFIIIRHATSSSFRFMSALPPSAIMLTGNQQPTVVVRDAACTAKVDDFGPSHSLVPMIIIAAENFVQQAAGPLVLSEYHRWTSRKSSTAPFNCSLSGAGPAESMSVMRK